MTDAQERKTMETQEPCPGCGGVGEVRVQERILTSHHIKNHAYRIFRDGEPLGERCDCKFNLKTVTRTCSGCAGRGYRIRTLPIPQPGDKCFVVNQDLLSEIFGEDEVPDKAGVVFDIQQPKQHGLELPNGLGVRLTWDRLNTDGTVPKGKNADLWAFDLTEIRLKK